MMIKFYNDFLTLGPNSGFSRSSGDAYLNYRYVPSIDFFHNYRNNHDFANYLYINRLTLNGDAEWRGTKDWYISAGGSLDVLLKAKQNVTKSVNYAFLGAILYADYYWSEVEKVSPYFNRLGASGKIQFGKGLFGIFCQLNLTPMFSPKMFEGENPEFFKYVNKRDQSQFWQYGIQLNIR